MEDLLGIQSTKNSPVAEKNNNVEDDEFFIFEQQETTKNDYKEEELHRFLNSQNRNIEMLNDYPKIKHL